MSKFVNDVLKRLSFPAKTKKAVEDLSSQIVCQRIRYWVRANQNLVSTDSVDCGALNSVLTTGKDSIYRRETTSCFESKFNHVHSMSKRELFDLTRITPLYLHFEKSELSSIFNDLAIASKLLPMSSGKKCCEYIIETISSDIRLMSNQALQFTAAEVYFDGNTCKVSFINNAQVSKESSVMKLWTKKLTWKQQTVLMCALRGCDMSEKNDLSKYFIRFLRNSFLNNAGAVGSDFMKAELNRDMIYNFSKEFDKYPIHFLLHLIHAYEIIGYEHPDADTANTAYHFYTTMVHAFHMNTESLEEMRTRLKDGVDTCCHKT